jgi:DNA-binding NarL/FixJ family response regulator
MTETLEEPRFLDGPKFIKWLVEEEGVDPTVLTDSQKRRWYDWKQGQRADLYSSAVDRIMTDHYISSRLVPDDVWSENQLTKNEGKTQLPPKEQKARKAEGRMLILAGVTAKQIANDLGVSMATIRVWKRQMRKEGLLD